MSIALKDAKVHGALFFVSVIYGANYSVGKVIVPDLIGPFGVIFFRVVVAGILFWILEWLTVEGKIISRKDFFRLAWCGLFGVAGNQLMFFKGLSITTPINASLMMLTTPVLVLILSYFILSERITFIKLLGIALALLGATLLVGGTDFSFNSSTVLGDIFIFLNACSYGIYLVLAKPLMQKYNPLTIVKWIFLFGSVIVIPFGINEVFILNWTNLPPYFYYSLAFIVIGTTFLAYLLNAWGLQHVNASVVSVYIYLQPILAVVFAFFIRGDKLTIEKIILSLFIFTGVYLVSKKQN